MTLVSWPLEMSKVSAPHTHLACVVHTKHVCGYLQGAFL